MSQHHMCACVISPIAHYHVQQLQVISPNKVSMVLRVCPYADSFQAYCQSALAFSIKRGGILYGTGAHCSPLHPSIHLDFDGAPTPCYNAGLLPRLHIAAQHLSGTSTVA